MRYQRIHSQIWSDEKFRVLSQDAKYLFIYILTNPHSNGIGIYYLPKQYIECDLEWSAKQLAIPFEELLNSGLILYDFDSRLICVKNQIKHNPIENPKQAKSAEKIISSLPKSHLFSVLSEQLNKPYHKPLLKLLAERYSIPIPQEEEEEKEKEIYSGSGSVFSKNGQVPYQEIQKAFNEICPDLPTFKNLTEDRRKAIKKRWNTDEATCHLEWWTEKFFPLIAESDFLTGRNGKWTACNIDWILNRKNFTKIREGTYNR